MRDHDTKATPLVEAEINLEKDGNAITGGSEVIVKENESLESALKRFKRQCASAGVQAEVRKREHYEKPSVRRKKKSEAARKRLAVGKHEGVIA